MDTISIYTELMNDIENFNTILNEASLSSIDYDFRTALRNLLYKAIDFIDKIVMKFKSEFIYKQSFFTKNKEYIRKGYNIIIQNSDYKDYFSYEGLNDEKYIKAMNSVSEIQQSGLSGSSMPNLEDKYVRVLAYNDKILQNISISPKDYSMQKSVEDIGVDDFVQNTVKNMNEKLNNFLILKRLYNRELKRIDDIITAVAPFTTNKKAIPEIDKYDNRNNKLALAHYENCIKKGISLINIGSNYISQEYKFFTKFAMMCIKAAKKSTDEETAMDTPISDSAVIYAESVEALGSLALI